MEQVKTWKFVVKLSKENPSWSQKTIAKKARISQKSVSKYWALVKRNLKETKGEANNIKSFKNKWRYSEKKVTKDTITALMGSINEKINDFSANK